MILVKILLDEICRFLIKLLIVVINEECIEEV